MQTAFMGCSPRAGQCKHLPCSRGSTAARRPPFARVVALHLAACGALSTTSRPTCRGRSRSRAWRRLPLSAPGISFALFTKVPADTPALCVQSASRAGQGVPHAGCVSSSAHVTHQRIAALRKSEGVSPVAFLNAVLKCCAWLKPQSRATSVAVRRGDLHARVAAFRKRRDVDDLAVLARNHVLRHGLAAQERSLQVDAYDRIPILY